MSASLTIQTSPESVSAVPHWFGEVIVIAHALEHLDVLSGIEQHVRFTRRRFGHYDLIDFVVVLLGYAISDERTLETFYEGLHPFAAPFMALFGRERLPHRSTLSRFLAVLNQAGVEALRAMFLEDLVARPLEKEETIGGMWDRQGNHWVVFDIDGTRQAARQRALPSTPDLPPAQRRLDEVCAPGYLGRKRGEAVRTRTTVLHAHTHQWIGTFSGASGAGNGDYRGELRQAVKGISTYMKARSVPLNKAVVRLDGQYGNGAIVADLAGLAYVIRGKDYDLLDLPQVQIRLAQPPDQHTTHPETGTCRALFDCPDLLLTPTGLRTRVIVATHPATEIKAPVGTTRAGVVYELFFTALPVGAFTPADVVALYLHRGAFEAVLADEDEEQDPDRWCSHTAWGQEFWLILAQWIWNIRLELGHALHPTPMRMTEFAPASIDEPAKTTPDSLSRLPDPTPVTYGPPQWARPSYTKGFSGTDFFLQPDGTLRCPAGRPLYAQERRPERNGSMRVLYAARIGHCRACPLRAQCQESATTVKARRVSAVYWPVSSPAFISGESPSPPGEDSPLPTSHPVLWGDWQRRFQTRKGGSSPQSEWQEGVGSLLLLAAASQTELLSQLEVALSPNLLITDLPLRLAHSQPTTLRSQLLTLHFLEAVGLQRTWDLRGYTGQALALLTDRHRAYGYRHTERFLAELASVGADAPLTKALAHWTASLWEKVAQGRENPVPIFYVDGHRKPVYADSLIPRGLIGRTGKILGCRALVVLHDQEGHPLLATTHRGDQHLTMGLPAILTH